VTEHEWLAHLDTFAALPHVTATDIADVLGAMMERINTVIVSYANRQHDEIQRIERRLASRDREREVGGE